MIDRIPNLCHAIADVPYGVELYQQGVDCFAVVYGQQVKTNLTYAQAAAEYGQCIMHALACAGRLDNSDPFEDEEPEPVLMLPHMVASVEHYAKMERHAGGTVEINYGLPYVAIKMSDGSEYFFQEHEASELLDSVPDNVSPEDFILWSAQGW